MYGLCVALLGTVLSASGADFNVVEVHADNKYLDAGIEKSGPDCNGGFAFDDGSNETNIGVGTVTASFVQMFSVPFFPFRFTAVCVSMRAQTAVTESIDVVFYAADGPGGAPGTLLGRVTRSIDVPATFAEFRRLDLGTDAPIIYDEDVYVGVSYDGDTNNVLIAADTSAGTSDHPFYYSGNGANWNDKDPNFASVRALLLRAEGDIVCTNYFDGILDDNSLHFDRGGGASAVNLNCELVLSDTGNDFISYVAVPIISPTGGAFVAKITPPSVGATVGDTVMFLYCDPFDPENPLANAIAYDDDSGGNALSAFTAARDITLQPFTRYWVVVAQYSTAAADGGFRLCLGNGYMRDTTCAFDFHGTLDSDSPHYNRIVGASSYSPACSLNNVDTLQDNMPYIAIPFRPRASGYFEARLIGAGTTIAHPVMTIYCDPFTPLSPGNNVVAYNDNGEGSLSAFTMDDYIALERGDLYWLVITTWAGENADGGDYQVCFSSDVTAWHPIQFCEEDSLFGQEPQPPYDSASATRNSTLDTTVRLDNFYFISAPITRVSWWGVQLSGAQCDAAVLDFQVSIYENNASLPGALVLQQSASPLRVDTGLTFAGSALYRYSMDLETPVELTTGWVRILGAPSEGCDFYWMRSNEGNNSGATTNISGADPVATASDFAFCLDTAPMTHTADKDGNGSINLSELLRVIQLYNSDGLHCDVLGEDGFNPGPGSQACTPHSSDYDPVDWHVDLSELLRLIQFYNTGAFHPCPEGEDGFCLGA